MHWHHDMIIRGLIVVAALAAIILFGVTLANASCASLQRLAQEHSDDMARRHGGHCRSRSNLDHVGFFTSRGPRGARAENVACASSAEGAKALWWASTEGHRENMLLPGCHAMAHKGNFWTMEIGE